MGCAWQKPKTAPGPRKGMPSPSEFGERYRRQFYDPAFASAGEAIDTLAEIAWQAYRDERKSSITREAGQG